MGRRREVERRGLVDHGDDQGVRTSRGSIACGVGRHGHVEAAVGGGGEVAQQDFFGVFQPEHVEANGRDETSAGVLPVLHLTHDVEGYAGGDGARHGHEGDGAGDLDGDVYDGGVSVATGVAGSESG